MQQGRSNHFWTFITHLSSDSLNDIFFLNYTMGIVYSGIEDNRDRM